VASLLVADSQSPADEARAAGLALAVPAFGVEPGAFLVSKWASSPRAHPVGQVLANGLSGPIVALIAVVVVLGGLALAWFMLRRLRPRVATVGDAEESTGLVVIGSVPRKGLRWRVRTMTGRPFRPPINSMQEILRVLERNGLGVGMRVLTVVPSADRSPSPSFAVDLARALAAQGHEVILVLANLRQPATELVEHPSSYKGLAELLQRDCPDALPLLLSVSRGLLLLTSGTPRQDPAALLRGPQLKEVIASVRRFGIVIIDAPPARFVADVLPLAGQADATLLVVYAGSLWKAVRETAGILWDGEVPDPAAVLIGSRRRSAAHAVRLTGNFVRG
jgi:Mrp family chromosome partitioning ATPase